VPNVSRGNCFMLFFFQYGFVFYVDAHGDVCNDHNKKAQGCQNFRVTRRAHNSSTG
jgi:hypothetical protein